MSKYIVLWEDAELGRLKMSFPMSLEKAKIFKENNNYNAVIVRLVEDF